MTGLEISFIIVCVCLLLISAGMLTGHIRVCFHRTPDGKSVCAQCPLMEESKSSIEKLRTEFPNIKRVPLALEPHKH